MSASRNQNEHFLPQVLEAMQMTLLWNTTQHGNPWGREDTDDITMYSWVKGMLQGTKHYKACHYRAWALSVGHKKVGRN